MVGAVLELVGSRPGLTGSRPWGVDSLAVGLETGRFRLRLGEAEGG